EDASHRADRYEREVETRHLETEKLARPGRALPTSVRRRLIQGRGNVLAEALVDLANPAVVDSLVVEPLHAAEYEAARGADDGRDRDLEFARDLRLRRASRCRELGDGGESVGGVGIAGLAAEMDQFAPLRAAKPDGLHRSPPPGCVTFGDCTISGMD